MATDINVIWNSGQRGYWDMSFLDETLSGFTHYETDPPHEEGGILIVAGRYGNEHRKELQRALDRMPWVVMCVVSDEHGILDWKKLRLPARSRVWVQYSRGEGRPLPVGYRPETRGLLRGKGLPDKHGWFYSGQVQHRERKACTDVLKTTEGGELHLSDGFAKGLAYDTYIGKMMEAELAPCPAGNCHPDCFRHYEALECHTLPVVLKHAYWEGIGAPFPMLDSWEQFPALVEGYDPLKLKRDTNRAVAWWMGWKREIRRGIERDMRELS